MTTDNHAKDQAAAQLEHIRSLVAALGCDYYRLKELRDELDALVEAEKDALEDYDIDQSEDNHAEVIKAQIASSEWTEENVEELAELQAAAGEHESFDAVIDNIQEHPLDVEVRSGWHSPGEEYTPPEEFLILICTGGPAVRIRGELDEHTWPHRAWLEYQDWGTPWTHYYEEGAADVLLTYCQQFYFGS